MKPEEGPNNFLIGSIRDELRKHASQFHGRDGDSLGDMAVLGDIPRTASLRARGNVQLPVIQGAQIHYLLRQNPDMSIQVIKLLVNRLAKP